MFDETQMNPNNFFYTSSTYYNTLDIYYNFIPELFFE